MYLCDGKIGNEYKVEDIDLPVNIEKRLEALGMTRGTSIAVLNQCHLVKLFTNLWICVHLE